MSRAVADVPVDRDRIERIVREVVANRFAPRSGKGPSPLRVNISARHMHISREHLEQLFGPGAELTPFKPLYQTGEFASEQTVDLIGPRRRMLHSVRILGPARSQSQIELAFTDSIALGIDAPVRMSGNHEGTPGCIVLGPAGHVVLERGVIRAQRHVHMNPADAEYYGVQNGEPMDLIVDHATCPVVIRGIIARIQANFKLEVHIDTDEGNCCDLPRATGVRLQKGRE